MDLQHIHTVLPLDSLAICTYFWPLLFHFSVLFHNDLQQPSQKMSRILFQEVGGSEASPTTLSKDESHSILRSRGVRPTNERLSELGTRYEFGWRCFFTSLLNIKIEGLIGVGLELF